MPVLPSCKTPSHSPSTVSAPSAMSSPISSVQRIYTMSIMNLRADRATPCGMLRASWTAETLTTIRIRPRITMPLSGKCSASPTKCRSPWGRIPSGRSTSQAIVTGWTPKPKENISCSSAAPTKSGMPTSKGRACWFTISTNPLDGPLRKRRPKRPSNFGRIFKSTYAPVMNAPIW